MDKFAIRYVLQFEEALDKNVYTFFLRTQGYKSFLLLLQLIRLILMAQNNVGIIRAL